MKTLKATRGGTCAACRTRYNAGETIALVGPRSWGHKACGEAVQARAQILAGETYRSQAPSTYTRRTRRD